GTIRRVRDDLGATIGHKAALQVEADKLGTMEVEQYHVRAPMARVVAEPGNGIRYELLLFQLPMRTSCGILGACDGPCWLVVCGLTGRSYLFQQRGHLAVECVAEKLGLRSAEDARVVTRIIAEVTGREAVGA